MKNFKKAFVAVTSVALLIAGGLTGCGSKTEDTNTVAKTESANTEVESESQKTNPSDDDLIPVRLGVGGQGDNYSMELVNLAYENGYLEEELKNVGYSLELQAFMQTGPEINAALASGSLDGAVYGDFPVFTSSSSGIETTIIAVANQKVEYGILSANDEIKEPKDLEGKRIIVGQGTVMQYFWEHYVAANNIDASKIEVINTTDGASLLQTGEADAYVSVMISAKMMESRGLGKLFDDSSEVPGGNSVTAVTLTNKFLADNPDAAVAINKALIRAYDAAVVDPESFYKALATEIIPEDIQKATYAADTLASQMNPEISDDVVTHLNDLNNWMFENKLIPSTIEVESIYNKSFYEQAVSELGK